MSAPVDDCLRQVGNRFMLATIVSRRWEQLMTGGRPMVPTRDPRSMLTAFREVQETKVKLNEETLQIERHGEPVEPLAPLEGTEEPLEAAAEEPDNVKEEE